MPVSAGPSRRFVFLLLTCSSLLAFVFVYSFRAGIHPGERPNYHTHAHPPNPVPSADLSPSKPLPFPKPIEPALPPLSVEPPSPSDQATPTDQPLAHVHDDEPTSSNLPAVIAAPLTNATLKAELGRASWKFLHTMLARYPKQPTLSEQTALREFLPLFARLYPCGECAKHFQKLLADNPPQVSNRGTAAAWGCHMHNLVNKRLGKEMYDCTGVVAGYDCGCGDEEGKKGEGKGGAKGEGVEGEDGVREGGYATKEGAGYSVKDGVGYGNHKESAGKAAVAAAAAKPETSVENKADLAG